MREYLRTSWSPDREYVDGRIEERNSGEKEHSIIQRFLTVLFAIKRGEWGVKVFPELRTQTRNTRFRAPDVLVMRAADKFERYVTAPPLIAVEILSQEDTLRAMQAKAAECRLFGVENIWIIDPEPRIAFRYADSRWKRFAKVNSPLLELRSEWCSARCLRNWTGSNQQSQLRRERTERPKSARQLFSATRTCNSFSC